MKKLLLSFTLFFASTLVFGDQVQAAITLSGNQTLTSLVTAGALTQSGNTYTTADTLVLGDGSTITSLVVSENAYIVKNHQWQLHANSNDSAVLDIGSDEALVSIRDNYSGGNWTSGGNFESLSGFPVVKFTNTQYSYFGGTASAFTSNDMNVKVDFNDVILNYHGSSGSPVPFFGVQGIWNNVLLMSERSGTSSVAFIGNPQEVKNLTIRNWPTGIKNEYGMGSVFEGLSFENTDIDAYMYAPKNNNGAGKYSKSFHFINSVSDKDKLRLNGDGSIYIWRGVKTSYKLANGTGVSGAYLYVTDPNNSNANLQESYNFDVEVTAQGVEARDTALFSGSIINNFFDIFQIGETINVSDVGDITLSSKSNTLLAKTGLTLSAETNRTLSVKAPVSGSDGDIPRLKVNTAFAQADGSNNSNGGGGASAKSLAQHIAGTAGYTRSAFERNNFDLAIISPYPYKREVLSVNLNHFELGDFSWNPLAIHDPLITETDGSIVSAYTELDTAQKAYDYKEWWKRQSANHLVGSAVNDVFILSGSVINAGSHNVVIDATATTPFAFDGTTITIKASMFTGNITTTGTVTSANGASISGGVVDSNGDSFITFNGVDSWTVYPNTTDRDSNTNVLESGTGTYRFNYIANTTYYLRLVVNGETLFKEITPTQSGETVMDLTVTGLLSTSVTKEQIAEQVWSEQAADHQITGSTGQLLKDIAGDGFDPNLHSLSKQVDTMLDRGILNFNTLKDLLE